MVANRWNINLVLIAFLIAITLPTFAADPSLGHSERAWERYLEQSDSETALKFFEKQTSRRDPAPMDWLGQATVLDSRERLGEAQTAYFKAFEAIWEEIQQYDPETIERIKQAEASLIPAELEQGTPDALDQAIWRWAIGQAALQSANQIAPYAEDATAYRQLLRSIAETEKVPGWAGFTQLQSEARFYLAESLRQRGDWAGAESLIEQNGFMRDFIWIGPFPNKEEAGYEASFPPEQEYNPTAEYEGNLRPVRWQTLSPAPRWGYVNFKAIVSPAENATAYGLSFVYSDKPRPIAVELGHAGAAKVWVAGRWVIGQDSYHGVTPFQVRAEAELEPGWNAILVKVCSEKPNQYGFFLRLTNSEGLPLSPESKAATGLKFWSTSDELPSEVVGWPLLPRDAKELANWNRDTLARLTHPIRDDLEASIAEWLGASYLYYHQSLDENSTEALDLVRLAEGHYPNSSLIQRWVGMSELDKNLSLMAYRKAAEQDPKEVLALSQLTRHYLTTPFKDKAMEVIQKGLARNPESPRLQLFEGEALLRQKAAPQLAQEALRKGIALSPDYFYGYYRLSAAEKASKSLPEIEKRLEQSLSRNRTAEDARLELVRAALHSGNPRKAAQLAEEALICNPWDIQPLEAIARSFRASKQWEWANAFIERALEIAPENARINALAGEIYNEQGRTDEARAAWQIALTVKPNDPVLEEYLNLISEDTDDYAAPYRIDLADLPEISDEDYPEAQIVVLLDHDIQKVYANGTSSRTTHLIRKALTDSGVNQLKSYPIYFEPGQEKVKIKRARVIRSDGSIFDAPRPRVQSARGGGSSRVYGDYSVQQLTFPAVDKGSIVDLEFEVQETGENIYVDYFGSQFYFGQNDPSLITEYVLITPPEKNFYWKVTQPDARYALPEAKNLASFPDDRLTNGNFFLESVNDQERVWAWNYSPRPRIPREPNMPAGSELIPYLKVSTFETWNDMAKWYWDLIKDQFQTDEPLRKRINELVDEYAQNEEKAVESLTDLEIVKALNRYVNTQIRYLGLEFGIDGYKPHKVVDICNAQYGDCKDKATLMVAMALEKGISGRIALVRTSDRGRIDLDLPSLHLFNHAIIYFPDLDGEDFILDGTAQFFGTTELPGGDQGTTLLTIIPGGSYEFVESPIHTAKINQAHYTTSLTLQVDGSADGTRRSDYLGIFNPSVRSIYQNRGKVKEIVEQQFGSAFPGTTADEIELSDLDNYEDPEWIQFKLSIPRFANQPAGQENRLTFRPIMFPANLSRSYAPLPRREHELVLRYNWSRIRKTEIEIPQGYRVVQLPEAKNIETPFGWLKLACQVEGSKIIVDQEVAIQVDNLRIPASNYEQFRDFCVRVDKAEEQQVILERTDS